MTLEDDARGVLVRSEPTADSASSVRVAGPAAGDVIAALAPRRRRPDRRSSARSPRRRRPPRRSWPAVAPAPSAAGWPRPSIPRRPSAPRRCNAVGVGVLGDLLADHRRASGRTPHPSATRADQPRLLATIAGRPPPSSCGSRESGPGPDQRRRLVPGDPARSASPGRGRHLCPGCARRRGPPPGCAAPDPCPVRCRRDEPAVPRRHVVLVVAPSSV